MRSRIALAVAIGMTATMAHAQATTGVLPPSGGPPGWTVGVGGGGIVTPDFRGSSSYRVRPVPALIARHGADFMLSGLEASYRPFRAGPWSAGAQARFRFGQKERDNPAALRGLGGVSPSVELGGFVGYGSGPVTLKASLSQDVAGGHGGQVAAVSAAYSAVLRRTAAGPVLLGGGPSLTWASGRFNRAYYGVDALQSMRSGLSPYRPGSGLESAGLSASLIAPLTRRVTLVGIAGYDRLLAKAADSPRVRLRGSRDQATIGAFLTYRLR